MARIDIATFDGEDSFSGYLAAPAGAPKGAIVVIQEIFGVNAGIRDKCDRWATLGYLAAAPDLFWRFAPGVDLDPDQPDEFAEALALMNKLDQDKAVEDIEATIRALRARLPEGGRVGVVGFCLGGRLAYMAAARTDADASVGYYGVGLEQLLGEQNAIGKPLLLHVAGADHFSSDAKREEVREGLAANPHVTLHTYPGEDHGFAAEQDSRRSEEAAQLANARTEQFFEVYVG